MNKEVAITTAQEPDLGRTFHLRKAMPTPLKRLYRLVKGTSSSLGAWSYDAVRFAKYSGTFTKERNSAARIAEITKIYHTIEKGLALPQPRPGFGKENIKNLCEKVRKAIQDGIRDPELVNAIDAISGYADFNSRNALPVAPWIEETLALAATHGIGAGVAPVKPGTLPTPDHAEARLDFIFGRQSVRRYADRPVPDEVLHNAAKAGQAAPCVCNRQASKVYFIRDPETKRQALSLQNGNRGFGDTAPIVAIVVVDLRNFLDASERYQGWIDGGLFTMNMLLGFHAQGYGACCLNWSALPAQDKRLRKLGIIQPHESVITMVAVGAPADDYVVARSPRKPLADVCTII